LERCGIGKRHGSEDPPLQKPRRKLRVEGLKLKGEARELSTETLGAQRGGKCGGGGWNATESCSRVPWIWITVKDYYGVVSFERETRKWSGWKELAGILGIRETVRRAGRSQNAHPLQKPQRVTGFGAVKGEGW